MSYLITAIKNGHMVLQSAGTDRLMKKWLQAFRTNGWKVEKVIQTKEGVTK